VPAARCSLTVYQRATDGPSIAVLPLFFSEWTRLTPSLVAGCDRSEQRPDNRHDRSIFARMNITPVIEPQPTRLKLPGYPRRLPPALRIVLVPIALIVDDTGIGPVEVDAALDQLGALGLVTAWVADADPVATLTPLAARRLGLKLRKESEGWRGLEWVPTSWKDRRERRRPTRIHDATSLEVNLDSFEGRALRPDQITAAAEAMARLVPKPGRRLADDVRSGERLPRPTRIITGNAAWGGEPTPVNMQRKADVYLTQTVVLVEVSERICGRVRAYYGCIDEVKTPCKGNFLASEPSSPTPSSRESGPRRCPISPRVTTTFDAVYETYQPLELACSQG